MPRKLIPTLGFDASSSGMTASPRYEPYTSGSAANALYNLLFCDDLAAFNWKLSQDPLPWQRVLLSMPIDVPAMQELASDLSQEGRIRYLAFSRLREIGNTVPPKILLGVIIEAPQAGGLDVLAAFCEGGVRYLNQSGKILVMDGATSFLPVVHRLFAASEAVVARIEPWDRPRLAPPVQGNVRLSFLVSDGLYFGEGPMPLMQDDAKSGPIIERATELLRTITAVGAG